MQNEEELPKKENKTLFQSIRERVFGNEPIYLYDNKEYKYKNFTSPYRKWIGPTKYNSINSIGVEVPPLPIIVTFSPVKKGNRELKLEVYYSGDDFSYHELIAKLISEKRIQLKPEPEEQSGGKRKTKTKKHRNQRKNTEKTKKKQRKTQQRK